MQIRGHGSAVAISLAALAVVIAGTGTAVAVAATTVTVVDPSTPAHAARVDAGGNLQVVTTGAAATINTNGLLSNNSGQDNFVTSPTTAVLNLTQLYLSETRQNSGAAGNVLRVYLYKTGVDSAGNCASNGYVLLGLYQLAAGDNLIVPFAAPLTVKPTAGAKYCLDLYSASLDASPYAANYFPVYQLTASVVSGKYAGIGIPTAVTSPPAQNRGTDR